MKIIFGIIIFSCLTLPVFSQEAGQPQRVRNLSDAIDTTMTRSNNNLSAFDQMITDGENTVTFSSFRRRYESLTYALSQSELQLHYLIRTNSRIADIRAERDNYQRLIGELQEVRTEFDAYMRNVR